METEPREELPLACTVSWAAFALALLCLVLFGWYVPADQDWHRRVFLDFHSPIPTSTKIVISIPGLAIQIVAGLLAAAALAVQWRTRDRRNAALFHMLIVLCCCVAFLAYREAVQETMSMLIQALR